MTIRLEAHTAKSFSEEIFQQLGKGYQHAMSLYTSWMRTGKLPPDLPIFQNAPLLFKQIISLCNFELLPVATSQSDGNTSKFLLRTNDGLDIESVLIPMKSGATLCVSSQIGCRMGCTFCETGRMGLLRNLNAAEIVNQLLVARHVLNLPVRNIVFMGMGEPFDNYEAVMQAVKVLTDPKGCNFGKRQITISTSGSIEGIQQLMNEPGETPNLAVSITAADDTLRDKLMPVNRKWNLEELHRTMTAYCNSTKREILIAYVLLQGVNDTLEHADSLASYLKGLAVKINVIPYNAQKRDQFAAPETASLEAFVARLRQHGYYTLLRRTKGRSIMAACGQLGNVEQRQIIRFNRSKQIAVSEQV